MLRYLKETLTLKKLLTYSGISLGMRPANERRRYTVTTSLIGWAHTWVWWKEWHVKFIFFNENSSNLNISSLKFVAKGGIDNKLALVQVKEIKAGIQNFSLKKM